MTLQLLNFANSNDSQIAVLGENLHNYAVVNSQVKSDSNFFFWHHTSVWGSQLSDSCSPPDTLMPGRGFNSGEVLFMLDQHVS